MPGGSKKGGGLTVKKSAVYKKQKFGEAKSPFNLKSGNTTPFKKIGSSPAKQKRIIEGVKSLYESGKKRGGIIYDVAKYHFKHGTFSLKEKMRRSTDPEWQKKE